MLSLAKWKSQERKIPICELYRFVTFSIFFNFTILWTLPFWELYHFVKFTVLWSLSFCEVHHFVNFTILWALLFCEIYHFVNFHILWTLPCCELYRFVNLTLYTVQSTYNGENRSCAKWETRERNIHTITFIHFVTLTVFLTWPSCDLDRFFNLTVLWPWPFF